MSVDTNSLMDEFAKSSIIDLMLSCIFISIGVVIGSYRQWLVLTVLGIELKWHGIPVTTKSLFYGQFLPSSIGQEVVKFLLEDIKS